jgi:AraC-like DNA-binding protein
VTVSARPANSLPVAAKHAPVVDMRHGAPVCAGTFPFDAGAADELVTGWHVHDLHQLEYAVRGVVEVETPTARYLLPPRQAVWVPAGLAHNTTLRHVESVSVFFEPALVPGAGDRARVLAAAPVVREMVLYATRWPIERRRSDAAADAFFTALGQVVLDWLDHEAPLCLPTSRDPVISAVMEYTIDHLDEVTPSGVCAAIGLSERTLRRNFVSATGMTWREYLLQARLLRAMARLAEPGPTVLDIATSVGFDSVSAFARAFRRYTGEAPTAYRRRVLPTIV